jgi:hypothetical protein
MFNSKVICCFKWLGLLQLETLPAASFQLSNLGTGQEPNGLQLGTGCAPNITTDLYITSLLIATVNIVVNVIIIVTFSTVIPSP